MENKIKDRKITETSYYRHFKNKWYKVLSIAEHTETGEKIVIYAALYGDFKVYARPYDMFVEEVPEGKENPTGQKKRFEHILDTGLSLDQFLKEIGLNH